MKRRDFIRNTTIGLSGLILLSPTTIELQYNNNIIDFNKFMLDYFRKHSSLKWYLANKVYYRHVVDNKLYYMNVKKLKCLVNNDVLDKNNNFLLNDPAYKLGKAVVHEIDETEKGNEIAIYDFIIASVYTVNFFLKKTVFVRYVRLEK